MIQIIANGVVAGSIYALVALGLGLIYTAVRFLHLGHGAVYTAGAYTAYAAIAMLSWNAAAGLILGVVVGVMLGVLMEIIVYRSLRTLGSSALVLLVCSLGMLVVIQNTISMLFGDQPRVLRFGDVEEGLLLLGARLTKIQLLIVIASLSLSIATSALIAKTKFGRILRAVANDPELARVCGINLNRTILATFMLGSGLASIAGILIGIENSLTPAMGFNALMMAMAAVIIGGAGSIRGSLFGGLLVGLAQHVGLWKLNTQWQDAVVFVILILFLILRPQGFFGRPLIRKTV
jgi:branched-chain amino acid transport system permease protein